MEELEYFLLAYCVVGCWVGLVVRYYREGRTERRSRKTDTKRGREPMIPCHAIHDGFELRSKRRLATATVPLNVPRPLSVVMRRSRSLLPSGCAP